MGNRLTSEPSSYRQIVHATSIIGSASAVNILAGIVRLKAAALLVGPAGVGVIGLLQSLVTTAQSIASAGIGISGTRHVAVAEALDDQGHGRAAGARVVSLSIALAIVGGIAFFVMHGWIARVLLGDATLETSISWLSIAVGLGVLSSGFTALLAGRRRIGDIARAGAAASVISVLPAIAILLLWRERGIVAFVLVPLIATFATMLLYALPLARRERVDQGGAKQDTGWGSLLRLGFASMLGGLASVVAPLIVRLMIQRRLGDAELGYFQAVWTLSMTYLGFVLASMSTDYYPRLTSVAADNRAANRLMNEQTHAAMLLAGPALLAMLGFAPWFLHLFYSGDFSPAATMLRLQVLGDVLKVASWPLGFLLLALNDGRTFVATEFSTMGVFIAVSWICIPFAGVNAAAIAFLVMYLWYLPLLYLLARRRTGFRWTRPVSVHFAALAAACATVFTVSLFSAAAAGAIGLTAAAGAAIYAYVQFRSSVDRRLITGRESA